MSEYGKHGPMMVENFRYGAKYDPLPFDALTPEEEEAICKHSRMWIERDGEWYLVEYLAGVVGILAESYGPSKIHVFTEKKRPNTVKIEMGAIQ